MKNTFLFIIILVAILALAEFLMFPNLYSTMLLGLILMLLLYIYGKIKNKENLEKEQTDYFHLMIHELKNPLAAIKLALGMVLEGSFGMLNSEQTHILEETNKKNEVAITLVDELLRNAKTELETTYQKTQVDVQDLVKTIVDSNKRQIASKNIRLALQTVGLTSSRVVVDKGKISLVVQNLLDNALHYTPLNGTILITLSCDKKYFEFTIKDSGIGIPENQKVKIFSKFFRASNAVKTEVPGSGLGLFIVKKVIEGHHGKVWFVSKEYEGSTFFFKIPVK